MRTENYTSWLDSLTDEEYLEITDTYGVNNLKIAYNDLLETLAEDFNKEIDENEEMR